MKKKIELGTVIFLIIVALVLSALATYMYLTSKMPSLVAKENFYDRISELYKTVQQRYIGEIDEKNAMNMLLDGYASGIDKYSTFLDAEEYAQYMSQMDGKYSGLGLTVRSNSQNDLIKVVDVNLNSPAFSAGIKAGDYISKIGGVSVVGVPFEEIAAKLKGEVGTSIDLTILRDDNEINKTVTISQYINPSVDFKLINDSIGYVSISEFSNTTFDDFKSSMQELKQKGAQKYIFDVRNNTGGSLTAVVKTLDYILPEGVLVTLKNKAGVENSYESDANKLDAEFVVLINGSTYSAGELFAAAVRDFSAAKLIGDTTYGKGYAQEIIPLSEGALYLSTKQYFPPNGQNFEGVGVSPDIQVSLTDEQKENFNELTIEQDSQLVAALSQLGVEINEKTASE